MANEDFYYEFTKLLNEFDLGCFNKSYIESCWDDDFTNATVLQEFEEEFLPISSNFNQTLDKLHDILYRVAQHSRWDEFWSMFREASISPSHLSTFLCCLAAKGFSALPAVTSRTLKVISCYLLLLSTPERNVYRILSFTTFDRALTTLQNSVTNLFNTEGRTSDGRKRKKARKDGPKKRKKGGKKNNPDDDDDDHRADNRKSGAVDDDDDINVGDSRQNVEELKEELLKALKDLCLLSGSGNLDETCKERMVEAAMEMVVMETMAITCSVEVYRNEDLDNMYHIPYKILHELIQSDLETFGKKSGLFPKICHRLLPHVSLSKHGQTIPPVAIVMRDNAVNFVRSIAEDNDGEKVETTIKNFIQHVCVNVADRADHRTKASQGLLPLLFNISPTLLSNISLWFTQKLSKSSKVPHRMFAVDVISLMLNENCLFALLGEESAKTHQDFARTLIDRCSDSSPSVRAKSIASLSKFTSIMVENTSHMEASMTHHPNINASILNPNVTGINFGDVLSSSVIRNAMSTRRNASRLESSSTVQPYNQHSMRTFNITASNSTINLPDNMGVVSMLRRRCRDPKVMVRKAAVLTLANVIILEGQNFNQENLASVSERCNDTSIAVRKQALQSLSDILQHLPSVEVQREWLRRILHSSSDHDTSIQTKCFDLLNQIILQGLSSSSPPSSCDYDDDGLAWRLAETLSGPDHLDQQKFFTKVCSHWNGKGLISDDIVDKLLNKIDRGDGSEVAWYLLSEFSSNSKDLDLKRINAHWSKMSQEFERQGEDKDMECSVFGSMLKILANINASNKSLSEEFVLPIIDHLHGHLMNFNLNVNDISFLVDVMNRISKRSEDLERKVSECFVDLFQNCKDYMNKCLSSDQIDETTLIRCIFTYGELVLVINRDLDEPSFHLLVKFIADEEQLRPVNPSQGSQVPLSQFRGENCPPDVRVFVFLSLGKFCLSKLEFAKLCVPALVRELSTSRDDRLKNNIIFILGDLIIKYAVIVDPYIGTISSHLQDPCPLIRKQTCLIFTRLLQEDFLKWRGSLFFRFLRGVVDDHPEVRETVIFTLKHVHCKRREGIFFQHFVESIFYFNDHKNVLSIGSYHGNDVVDTERNKAFLLVGNSNLEKRMEIYKFLLESMNDSQRFQAMGKLVNEVMSSFVEGTIGLNDKSSMVLKDALMCLSCQEIKLSLLKHHNHHDNDVDDSVDLRTAVENVAKKQLITEVMKKTIMESTVPTVVALKQMLEKHRSPLLKDLMNYLIVLMKDYKNEIKDILKIDPKLELEVEFDMRRMRLTDNNDDAEHCEGLHQSNCDDDNEGNRHNGKDGYKRSSDDLIQGNNYDVEGLPSNGSRGNSSLFVDSVRRSERNSSNKKRTSQAAMETIRTVMNARHQRQLLNKSII